MLTLRPISVKESCRWVARNHRHNRAPAGGLFAASVVDEAGTVRGVGIVGRPVARLNDDGWTAEITRVCTDGSPNACSMLYGACCRAAKALGYRRVITYTLAEEPGTSLRAAGFGFDAAVPVCTWNRPNRSRSQKDLFGDDVRPPGEKVRWVRRLAA